MKKDLTGRGDCIIFKDVGGMIARGHTGKGKPWAMVNHDRPLTNRQQRLLDSLPGIGSRVVVKKSDVSMPDLAAMTLEAGVEFAMFTLGPKRLIMRGDNGHVYIDDDEFKSLSAQGYKWSGHTHPGSNLVASDGDCNVLAYFSKSQKRSVVYNAEGKRNIFLATITKKRR